MIIKLPVKIHNKFEIEVIEVTTGEVVQKGYAENIILDNLFQNMYMYRSSSTPGNTICFGGGTGELNPARTALFQPIGYKTASVIEFIANQAPLESYMTKQAIINPADNVGAIITEVGLGNDTGVPSTHALIKDSEGNPLSLGPKTATQEIRIYATVFFQPNFEPGITLRGTLISNGLLKGATLHSYMSAIVGGSTMYTNLGSKYGSFGTAWGPGKLDTGTIKILTSEMNGKIKTIEFGSTTNANFNSIVVNLTTLAQNNSSIWGGHSFDKTLIGTGDGSKTVFTLPWDEARLDKDKKIYIDGVEVISGFTWASGSITFDSAPMTGAVITGDYWVDYVPKDNVHELWINLSILFGEGAAA